MHNIPVHVGKFLQDDQAVLADTEQRHIVEQFWSTRLQSNRTGSTFKKAMRDAHGVPQYVVAVVLDITEQQNALASLRTMDEKLQGLFSFAPMGIALTDMQGHYIEFNREFERICGYSKDELNALDYFALTPREWESKDEEQFKLLRDKGWHGPYEKEYIRKDGSRIPLEFNGTIIRDSDGQSFIWSIVQDISERKRTEIQVKTALKEREELLREVHHRVKNNMQIISSLLRMEGRRTAQPEVKAVLDQIQGRIRAMTMVHEMLFKRDALDHIDLDRYLRELATLTYRTHIHRGNTVQLELDLEHVKVSMELATSIGLIANELISNALKHAFEDGDKGTLRVHLKAGSAFDLPQLQILDDGVGLPEGFDINALSSLGLVLVQDLARQVGGELIISRHGETCFMTHFKSNQ